jgi:hypothetical protein
MRLKPLLTVELALLRRLSLPDDIEESTNEELEAEGGVVFTGKLNPEGGYEVPAMMTANAARGGPINSTRTSTSDDTIRPRSLHGEPEHEAVKLDFNPPSMHTAAVDAAKEGVIDFSAPSFSSLSPSPSKGDSTNKHHDKHINKTASIPGRPRARSSVDISGIEGSMHRPSLPPPPPLGTTTAGAGSGSGHWPLVHSPSSGAALTPVTVNMAYHLNNGTGDNVGYTAAPGTAPFTMHPSVSASSLDLERHNSRTSASEPVVPMPEFFVRSTTNWKEKLRKWKRYDPGAKIGAAGIGADGGRAKSRGSDWNPWDEDEDPAHLIQAW